MKIAYQLSVLANEHMTSEQFEAEVQKGYSSFNDVLQIHPETKRISALGESAVHYSATMHAIKYGHFTYQLENSPGRLLYQLVLCVELDDRVYIDRLYKALNKFPHRLAKKMVGRECLEMKIDCDSIEKN